MISLSSIRSLLARISFSNIVEIKKVKKGQSTHVFSIIAESGEKYYLRIPKDPKESILSEVLIHKKLLKACVKVPNVVAYGDSSTELKGSSFILIESIGNDSCAQLSYSDSKIEEILKNAGKDLFLINSIPVEMFGAVYRTKDQQTKGLIGDQINYKDFIYNRIEKNVEILEKSHFFSEIQISIIKRVLNSEKFSLHVLNMKQGYLAHGDYNLEHIFQNKGSYTGVIDFGDAKSAPKGYDLAYFKICNPSYFDSLLSGYVEASGNHIPFYEDVILVFLVGIRILSSAFENDQIKDRKDCRFQSFLRELEILRGFIN